MTEQEQLFGLYAVMEAEAAALKSHREAMEGLKDEIDDRLSARVNKSIGEASGAFSEALGKKFQEIDSVAVNFQRLSVSLTWFKAGLCILGGMVIGMFSMAWFLDAQITEMRDTLRHDHDVIYNLLVQARPRK